MGWLWPGRSTVVNHPFFLLFSSLSSAEAPVLPTPGECLLTLTLLSGINPQKAPRLRSQIVTSGILSPELLCPPLLSLCSPWLLYRLHIPQGIASAPWAPSTTLAPTFRLVGGF